MAYEKIKKRGDEILNKAREDVLNRLKKKNNVYRNIENSINSIKSKENASYNDKKRLEKLEKFKNLYFKESFQMLHHRIGMHGSKYKPDVNDKPENFTRPRWQEIKDRSSRMADNFEKMKMKKTASIYRNLNTLADAYIKEPSKVKTISGFVDRTRVIKLKKLKKKSSRQ